MINFTNTHRYFGMRIWAQKEVRRDMMLEVTEKLLIEVVLDDVRYG